MANASLSELTITGTLALLDKRELCSRSLVERLISAIEARDPKINAYLSVDADYALAQAAAADRHRESGGGGTLLGLPIAVDDSISVAGQPCGCASKIMEGYKSPYDATAAARLRAEGAVFLGRANMAEFDLGASTEDSAYKVTLNPWNTDCVASGGAAAAVAGGEAIAALGTDSDGSVRLSASLCGCVGFKPSYGRVSRYGLAACVSSCGQAGLVAKETRDVAKLLSVVAGADPSDAASLDMPVPDYEVWLSDDLSGLRIGMPVEYFNSAMDDDVERLVRNAARQLERLGASLLKVNLPMTEYAVPAYAVIASAESAASLARFDGVSYGRRAAGGADPNAMYHATRSSGFGREVKACVIFGCHILSGSNYKRYFLRAQKTRALIRRDFEKEFNKCDALLAPVAPYPARRAGEERDSLALPESFLTAPASLAGLCALSLPCGFTAGGLPVGLQLIGPQFKEETILKIAHAYEQSVDWKLRKPD